MIGEKELKNAYDLVSVATTNAFKVGDRLAILKNVLGNKVLSAWTEEIVVCKNEAERKACAYDLFKDSFDLVEKAQAIYDKARHELELAKLHVDYCKQTIKIADILSRDTSPVGRM